jgi:hypothetical protein
MKGQFLGGGNEVGRLGFVLDASIHKFLFDYGINPTKPPQFPAFAPKVDAVFLLTVILITSEWCHG